MPDFDEDAGSYAIRIKSVDAVGNKSDRSNIVEFDYLDLNNFEFEDVEDAELEETYESNEITM